MAENHNMIDPFVAGQVRYRLPTIGADSGNEVPGGKIISYGVSSYGLDIRCAPEFKVFTNVHNTVVDPKNFDENSFVDIKGESCTMPPNSFVLTRSVEYLRIPRDTLVLCIGKSSYARCGLIVNVTPLQPEWEGHITLEISNTTPLPAKVYANEGIAMLLFLRADEACQKSYKDMAGKYQGQQGITLPKA
jgi:dCTP deaminase